MKFPLGRIVWTRGVNDRVAVDTPFAKFVMDSLKRHANCDWGELSAEDKRENDFTNLCSPRLGLFAVGVMLTVCLLEFPKYYLRYGLSQYN